MQEYKSVRQQDMQSVAEVIFSALRLIMYGIVGIYMVLILVVLPFYNTEGYSHMGTEKAEFFLKSAAYCGGAVLPVLILAIIAKIIVLLQKYGMEAWYDLEYYQVAHYFKKRYSITDCFVMLYGVSVVVSYLNSDYKQEALWGAEYWYMGLISQFVLVVSYFFVSRAQICQKWIALLILPVSAVVFFLGYLNRFGIYPIDMKMDNVQFISTIGNINWYCGYLVTIFFGGFYLFWQGAFPKLWQKLLLAGYVAIGFATLVTQGSSSGIVTMVVLLLIMFRVSASKSEQMENFWKGMALFSLVCLVTYVLRWKNVLEITYEETTTEIFTNSPLAIVMTIVSVAVLVFLYLCKKNKSYPQKFFEKLTEKITIGILFLLRIFVLLMVINTLGDGILSEVTGLSLDNILTFSTTWGSNRGATWMAGIRCFAEQDFLHMLIGVGPDSMAAFLYSSGSDGLVEMVQDCFGAARLTNAHNEWLTILVNMGLLGFVSFAGIIISAIKRFGKNAEGNPLVAACGVCLLAYTVNNMFSFQQAMNVSTIFVLLGTGENALRRRKLEAAEDEKNRSGQVKQEKKPILWLAGDSTMQSYVEENRPQWGWGELLLEKLESKLKEKSDLKADEQAPEVVTIEAGMGGEIKKQEYEEVVSSEIAVAHREDSPFPQQKRYTGKNFIIDNCAMAGRSSKTFREEGRLQDIAEHIQEGDYLLIQFGHNDAGKSKQERYVALEDFRTSLKYFVDVAFSHGATPILLSSIALCPSPETEQGEAGEISNLLPMYGEEMLHYARELDIPFIDMNGLTRSCLAGMSKEESESMYMPDHVHLVHAGAETYAELAAEEILAKIHTAKN